MISWLAGTVEWFRKVNRTCLNCGAENCTDPECAEENMGITAW